MHAAICSSLLIPLDTTNTTFSAPIHWSLRSIENLRFRIRGRFVFANLALSIIWCLTREENRQNCANRGQFWLLTVFKFLHPGIGKTHIRHPKATSSYATNLQPHNAELAGRHSDPRLFELRH